MSKTACMESGATSVVSNILSVSKTFGEQQVACSYCLTCGVPQHVFQWSAEAIVGVTRDTDHSRPRRKGVITL